MLQRVVKRGLVGAAKVAGKPDEAAVEFAVQASDARHEYRLVEWARAIGSGNLQTHVNVVTRGVRIRADLMRSVHQLAGSLSLETRQGHA